MAKQEENTIELIGIVEDVLPQSRFRIKLENSGRYVVGYTAGKIRHNRIKILMGDKVTLEMTPYNTEMGRIVYRH